MGLLIIVSSMYSLSRKKKSLNWSLAYAEILSSEVIYIDDEHNHPVPQIFYRYLINKVPYTSGIYQLDRAYKLKEALSIVKKYKVGRKITVYYDTNNPSNAVIVKGYNGYERNVILLGIIFILMGSYGLNIL